MKRRVLAILVILALCVTAMAAADEPTTITLKSDQLLLTVGGTAALNATVAPHAAHRAGVTYLSSDEGIVTVDEKGRVRGVALGSCEIVVTSVYDASVSATVNVQVITLVQKLVPDAGDAQVYVGGTLQLSVAYEPADATLQQVTYASSHENIATVSKDGVVTGVKRGTADIVITSADGHAKAKQRITVLQPVASISITARETILPVGGHTDLKATVEPSDASNKKVIWSSSDEEIASVDEKGRVTSHAPGEVIITAACEDDPSVSTSVTIEDEQLATGVAFTDTEITVRVGETVKAGYVVSPEDVSDPSVTFELKHPKFADVDESGRVTGVKAGKTTLYVYTADGTKRSDHILVTVVQPVTGVAMEKQEVRVGVDYYTHVKALLQPDDATDLAMTWESSDESVATVSGDTNVVKIRAHSWGDCVVTGTTVDGGYTASILVHGGSFNHAIKVVSLSIKSGRPYISLENVSNLTITRIRFYMEGFDHTGAPIAMSTKPNVALLSGSYDLPLMQGQRTEHSEFTFNHPAKYGDLQRLDFILTGFETEDGFSYTIPDKARKTVQYFSDLFLGK